MRLMHAELVARQPFADASLARHAEHSGTLLGGRGRGWAATHTHAQAHTHTYTYTHAGGSSMTSTWEMTVPAAPGHGASREQLMEFLHNQLDRIEHAARRGQRGALLEGLRLCDSGPHQRLQGGAPQHPTAICMQQ